MAVKRNNSTHGHWWRRTEEESPPLLEAGAGLDNSRERARLAAGGVCRGRKRVLLKKNGVESLSTAHVAGLFFFCSPLLMRLPSPKMPFMCMLCAPKFGSDLPPPAVP